jgi:hypothetical protein
VAHATPELRLCRTRIFKTKARELLKDPTSPFTIKIGNRYYANKKKLDQWLDRNSGN